MENFNYERFIDELVRNSVVGTYNTRLYEEKLRILPSYVTEEDKDAFLFDAARVEVTSSMLSDIVTDFIQSVPDESLEEHKKKQHFAYDLKEMFPPGRELANNSRFGGRKYNENYCAQLIGHSNKIVNYKQKHEQVWNYFTQGNKGWYEANQQFKNQILPVLKQLPVEEKNKLLNKLLCTIGLGNSLRTDGPYFDWEYVKMLNGLSDQDKRGQDFREMLASVGIDMGYMPKTFVSEIYGNTQGRNR